MGKTCEKVCSSVFSIVIGVILIIGMAVRAEAGSVKLPMADFIPDGYAYNTYGNEYAKDFDNGYLKASRGKQYMSCCTGEVSSRGHKGKNRYCLCP